MKIVWILWCSEKREPVYSELQLERERVGEVASFGRCDELSASYATSKDTRLWRIWLMKIDYRPRYLWYSLHVVLKYTVPLMIFLFIDSFIPIETKRSVSHQKSIALIYAGQQSHQKSIA